MCVCVCVCGWLGVSVCESARAYIISILERCGLAQGSDLADTRYFFVSEPLCTNQYYSLRTHPLFRYPTTHRHRPHDCAIKRYPPTPRYCKTHHKILAITKSCKG